MEGTVLGKQCQILSAMSNNTKKSSGIQTRPPKACITIKTLYFEYNLIKKAACKTFFLHGEKKKEKEKENKNKREKMKIEKKTLATTYHLLTTDAYFVTSR